MPGDGGGGGSCTTPVEPPVSEDFLAEVEAVLPVESRGEDVTLPLSEWSLGIWTLSRGLGRDGCCESLRDGVDCDLWGSVAALFSGGGGGPPLGRGRVWLTGPVVFGSCLTDVSRCGDSRKGALPNK